MLGCVRQINVRTCTCEQEWVRKWGYRGAVCWNVRVRVCDWRPVSVISVGTGVDKEGVMEGLELGLRKHGLALEVRMHFR